MQSYRQLLPESASKSLDNKIQALKEHYEHGSVSQIMQARTALDEELNKYPVLNALENLRHAADITAQEAPAKAPRYDKYLYDIEHALSKGDMDTFQRLLTEIMPEVNAIISGESRKNLHIWKEIRK
jgi:hypothetical protein